MIRARRGIAHEMFLDWYLRYKFSQNFSEIIYHFEGDLYEESSILLTGNHATWWDGFIGWKINKELLKKRYHVMMLEKQLKKVMYFHRCGAFSIDPSSDKIKESLLYALDLLKQTDSMILFYPQGKLQSLYIDSFTFNKGIEWLLKKSPETSLLFYAAFVDYGSHEKPYMNIFFQKVTQPSSLNFNQLSASYSVFYDASKKKHLQLFKA